METSPPREDALSRQVHSRGIIWQLTSN